jgi:hypothetical protein
MRTPFISPRKTSVTAAITAEQIERRRQIRGLVFLAFAVLIFSITRAGWHRVFTVGWWRLW